MDELRSILNTSAGPRIDEVVIAHQRNVQQLATQITQAAGTDQCPPSP